MNIPQNIEEKLWSYIDGSLEKDENNFVEQLLQHNQEWKAKYAELMDVHQLMQDNIDLEHPSLRFTQNVMEEISRLYITPATRNYINKNVIWGIGIFFLTTIIGLIIYTFGQINWSAPSSSGNIPEFNMTNVNWGQMFNSTYVNVFIMVNAVLVLVLLDRVLANKRKQFKRDI